MFSLAAPCVAFSVARAAAVAPHECAHCAAALALGVPRAAIHLELGLCGQSRGRPHVLVEGITVPAHARLVQHAGWCFSVVLAVAINFLQISSYRAPLLTAAWLTALEAVSSDLLCLGSTASRGERFSCGNFGILLLECTGFNKRFLLPALRRMMRVTIVRGAQSAGVVVYRRHTFRRRALIGKRLRVVSGKRTDLPTQLLGSGWADCLNTSLQPTEDAPPQFWQGHT